MLKAIGIAIVGIALAVAVILLIFSLGRAIYHLFSPAAKQRYLIRKQLEKEEAEHALRRKDAEATAQADRLARETQRRLDQQAQALQAKQSHRDANTQDQPYVYTVGRHANEALAIRYGIANQVRVTKEYWYYARGGRRTRNPEKDSFNFSPASEIRLRKVRLVDHNIYDVVLTDFRDRPARAVIEIGTEYVKTFLPLDDSWFERYADLELTLKGNGSFSLKELATFHVQKVVSSPAKPSATI